MSKTSAGFEIFIGKHQKWNQGLGTKTLLNTIYLAKNKYNLKNYTYLLKKQINQHKYLQKSKF